MKYVLRYSIIAVFLILFLEITLRFLEYKPYPPISENSEVSKPGDYDDYSPVWGICLLPGKFTVTNNESKFFITHNNDSCRITKKELDTIGYNIKPSVNIYGCSFTWGSGISDSSTYPFLIQTALTSYNINNYGTPAAGNIVTFLKIKEQIKNHRPPKIAIVSYASFHDVRNTWNREWATLLKQNIKSKFAQKNKDFDEEYNFIDTLKFPRARLVNDTLQISYMPMNGDLFPFSKYSSLSNAINNILIKIDESRIQSNLVTRKLFYEINKMCKEHKIRLIIACIDNDQNTLEMQKFFNTLSIEYLSFNVDYLNNRNYNLYPDAHPNERANVIYAKKIIDYLLLNP